MPNFMNVLELISLPNRLSKLGCTPRSMQGSLGFVGNIGRGSLQERMGLFFRNAGLTERKCQFATTSYWQNGVEQPRRWENVNHSQAKLLFDIEITRTGDDLGVPHRVLARFC